MNVAHQALAELGRAHLGAATSAVLVCPRQHRLGRLINTRPGVVYLAEVQPPRLHSTTRRMGAPVAGRPSEALAWLLDPDTAQWAELASSCECGNWSIPGTYALEVATEDRERRKGVPRVVVDAQRVARA